MGFLFTLLNIFFPIKCLSCGKFGTYLCLSCLGEAPEALRETHTWIFPVYDYRHPTIKKALWLLKYRNKIGVAKIFAESLYGKILEELSDFSLMENFSQPLLIPIPLSRKRHKERGYNQAELLCREIIKLDNLRQGVDMKLEKKVLIKPQETEHQARIGNKRNRLKNIMNSFAVENAERIQNKNIILVDDITTTGATLSEAKRVLRQAGARKVIAFTVAH